MICQLNSYVIGNAPSHLSAGELSYLSACPNATVLIGSLTFASGFGYATERGLIKNSGGSFFGSNSGPKCVNDGTALIVGGAPEPATARLRYVAAAGTGHSLSRNRPPMPKILIVLS